LKPRAIGIWAAIQRPDVRISCYGFLRKTIYRTYPRWCRGGFERLQSWIRCRLVDATTGKVISSSTADLVSPASEVHTQGSGSQIPMR